MLVDFQKIKLKRNQVQIEIEIQLDFGSDFGAKTDGCQKGANMKQKSNKKRTKNRMTFCSFPVSPKIEKISAPERYADPQVEPPRAQGPAVGDPSFSGNLTYPGWKSAGRARYAVACT